MHANDIVYMRADNDIRSAWEHNHKNISLEYMLKEVQNNPEYQLWLRNYADKSFDYKEFIKRCVFEMYCDIYFEWCYDFRKAVESHDSKWLIKHGIIYDESDWV